MERLLSQTADHSLLISRFQEFLEKDDIRYYVMSAVRENVSRVLGRNKGVEEPAEALYTPWRWGEED